MSQKNSRHNRKAKKSKHQCKAPRYNGPVHMYFDMWGRLRIEPVTDQEYRKAVEKVRKGA